MSKPSRALFDAFVAAALGVSAVAAAEEAKSPSAVSLQARVDEQKPPATPVLAPKQNPFVPPTIGITPAPVQQQSSESVQVPAAPSSDRLYTKLTYVGTINGNEIYSFNDQCYVTVKNDRFVDDQCYRIAMRGLLNSSDKH